MADMQQIMQQNALARAAVTSNAVKMTQQIFQKAFDPAAENVVTVSPKYVGLILGFIVRVSGTLTNGAGNVANRTQFGTANLVKNFNFTDLNSITRINTSGRHIALLNSARQGFAFGGAYTPTIPINYGANFNVNTGPSTIAASTDAAVQQLYYIPLSYSASDLRGAMYASVVNATANLQITINKTPFINTGDGVDAVYSNNAAGAWKTATNVTVEVYQVYYDQLPKLNGAPVLPIMDINQYYELKETTVTGITAATDFPYSYANFRDFYSTFAIYSQNATLAAGTDVNYWSLLTANLTQIFKYTPTIAALLARGYFMSDLPLGTYYFDHSSRPLNTNQFGNIELNINASAAAADAKMIVSTEAFATSATLNAQSLDAG